MTLGHRLVSEQQCYEERLVETERLNLRFIGRGPTSRRPELDGCPFSHNAVDSGGWTTGNGVGHDWGQTTTCCKKEV